MDNLPKHMGSATVSLMKLLSDKSYQYTDYTLAVLAVRL